MTITHIPKGLMCFVCEHRLRKCNHLPFKDMRVMDVDKTDGIKTVKCTDFEHKNKD